MELFFYIYKRESLNNVKTKYVINYNKLHYCILKKYKAYLSRNKNIEE